MRGARRKRPTEQSLGLGAMWHHGPYFWLVRPATRNTPPHIGPAMLEVPRLSLERHRGAPGDDPDRRMVPNQLYLFSLGEALHYLKAVWSGRFTMLSSRQGQPSSHPPLPCERRRERVGEACRAWFGIRIQRRHLTRGSLSLRLPVTLRPLVWHRKSPRTVKHRAEVVCQ